MSTATALLSTHISFMGQDLARSAALRGRRATVSAADSPLVANVSLAAERSDAAKPQGWELRRGDRIVLLGGTLIEREQRWGYWETALLAATHVPQLQVRNLGWSGDTVFGESRGRFEFANSDYRFRQIVEHTRAWQPTVILIHYGGNEAYAGPDGLPQFEKGLDKLLDALQPIAARILLLTPCAQRPFAGFDPTEINKHRRRYGEIVQAVARRRSLPCVDLYNLLEQAEAAAAASAAPESATEYGLHLTATGYRLTATVFVHALGLPAPQLGWDKLEQLRQAVVAKNTLFFHRWRPQNETYLFGFRKHEQGKNAKEVAAFDPLIQQAEQRMEQLRQQLGIIPQP
jgi:lysophospholipase L1-like esterase